MTDTNQNLKHYFRKPEIMVKLPSRGKYYPKDSIELGTTFDVEVYSMTGKDELLFKTPDALIGGVSTFRVIESCIPQIKHAEDIPVIDLDTILIAIRIATYGNIMEIKAICPECNEENNFDVNLSELLDEIPKNINFNETVNLDNNLKINIRPLNFKIMNDNLIKEFEKNRSVAALNNEDISEQDRLKQFYDMMLFMIDSSVETIVHCIDNVITEDNVIVTNKNIISELIQNLNRLNFVKIQDEITKFLESTNKIKVSGECTKCKHKWEMPLTFDGSSFFD